ncbi:FkbM family methyltransferase [Rhizobium sp. CC1099]|uniref:FkbM family methyltransferase n=1 Tax=Rhizobium sp. CC1099 TaxID=3039160 RepID=UPI0024B18B88|nr:FkbM family methyltransferase [Rhizobium sp. CC1099]WFU86315.1 FkbM family methyltransferase [Rhizobium sp. CC1099]
MFVETFPSHYLKKIDAMEKPDYLRSLATNAKTIIDIGVHTGTPRLYKAFNDLPFVLIDPAKGAEERLQHKPKNYIYVNKAVGESKDKLTLNVNSWFTSLLEPKGVFKTWEVLDRYEVEIDRLDSIIEDVGAKGPFGVKMDIQGFELAAVRGMTKMWPQVDFLICETNIRNTAEGTYQFSDLVVELLKHDFVFFNILNNFKPNARFYDVVFLPRNSQKFNVLE